MKNWYSSYRFANSYYNGVINDEIFLSLASDERTSDKFKKLNLKRWMQLHKIVADELGIDKSHPDFLTEFLQIGDIFRELTDRLKRLPTKNEFLSAWRSWKTYKELKSPDSKPYMHEGLEVGEF